MHDIEKQLHLDHYHISRLLRCLQRSISNYELQGAWAEHLSVILDALDYIKVYPEHWHHPVEDQIFAYIARRYPVHGAVVAALQSEHEELEAMTRQLNLLFSAIANDTVVPMSQLTRVTREFLTRQLAHIDRENELIYPLLSNCLTPADWALLEAQIDEAKDPLFGPNLRQEYEALHDYVIKVDEELNVQRVAHR